ncbi:non-specific lipid-transfer protein [Panicum miliaceum]|uniref:Non-specific lipid-transfer protein n=1 Tax=Panicum miliaceum TaxID=4540 RepID=A0A3L6S0S9_PANMI|nr:non-specific lipid-transfer protein [Panicum miliaceum]
MQGLLAVALAVACACAAAASAPVSYAQGSGTAAGGSGGGVPSCAAKLAPCAAYLNSTSAPPPACCAPLKEAAANETACMCAMLLNKAALQAFRVAPEQGLGLAKRCGVTADASACAKSATTAAAAGAGAATGSGTAASSASTGGSASTVTKPTSNGGGVRHRVSLTGASALVGFSFIWWVITA